MSRLFILLGVLSALALARAEVAAPATDGTDRWLDTLTTTLASRYQVTGELKLSWNRPRPATAAADAELAILAAPAELTQQILVKVRATDAAGQAAEHILVLRAELWREGWMLRDPASVGSPLIPGILEIRRFDALRERDALPSDVTDEFDFARNLPAGRLLLWRDVVRRPLVRRGQPLEVVASDGALTITLHAVALNDAARGESVRVRNPDSKKEFVAQVVSESRATIRF